MPKVSIVVPVYNTQKYLGKCLDSLVNQTLKDIEIIVINDGSTDDSNSIIDTYVKTYPNKVFGYTKENGGLSDARNYGINKCHGDYIGFIDSDDYADLDMFKCLYEKAISNNFDLTVCDVRYVYDDKTEDVSSLVDQDIIDPKEIKKQMINIYPVAWNKLYKKELFKNNVFFKKGVWYEDVEFLYCLFPYIKTIGTVKKPLINYVQRSGAISKTFDVRVYNYIDNWNGIIAFYKEKNFYNEYYPEIEYSYVKYLYTTFIKAAANFDKKEYNKACKIAKENVLKNFPNYKKNKYLKKGLENIYLKHFNKITNNLVYISFNMNKKSK